jgi:YegS/Rv2252/BmrU family lipid kinase
LKTNLLIINPIAGKGNGFKFYKTKKDLLNRIIPNLNIVLTSKKGEIGEIIATNNEIGSLFVAGGDGTFHEVVNALNSPNEFPITLFPMGSGNDFARALGLRKKSIEQIVDLWAKKSFFKVDIGEYTYREHGKTEFTTERFHNSCGSGFDATVTHLSNQNKVLRGLILYLYSVIKALLNYKSIEAQAIFDESVHISGKKLLIAVGNSETSGGGFKLTPGSVIDDGVLKVVMGDDLSVPTILHILPRAIFGTHITDHRVTILDFKHCTINFAEPVIVQSDGEILSTKVDEIDIHVKPKFLYVTGSF